MSGLNGASTSSTVGCAIFPHDGADPAQLLDSADASLLARKRTSNGGGRRINGNWDRQASGATAA